MSVDNASLRFDVAPFVPPNIAMVAWDGDASSGFVERNDSRMTEKISELSPHAPHFLNLLEMLDAWIVAAAGTPVWADPGTASPTPLTPTQIRQIKTDMVDAVYNSKRLQPRWYGSYLYEMTNEAIAHMAAAADVGSVESGDLVAMFNANVNTYNNPSIVYSNPPLSTMRNNWEYITQSENEVQAYNEMYSTGGTTNQPGHQHPWTDKNVFTTVANWSRTMSWYGLQSPIGGVDPNSILIRWQPLAEWPGIPLEAPRDIIASTLRNALRELLRHRVALAERRLEMRRYIANPVNSIGQVMAYDVSTGWPL